MKTIKPGEIHQFTHKDIETDNLKHLAVEVYVVETEHQTSKTHLFLEWINHEIKNCNWAEH